jgi:hypothetical protein
LCGFAAKPLLRSSQLQKCIAPDAAGSGAWAAYALNPLSSFLYLHRARRNCQIFFPTKDICKNLSQKNKAGGS